MSCLLEVLLDSPPRYTTALYCPPGLSPSPDVSSLALGLDKLLLANTTLAEVLEENLTLVCAKQRSKEHLGLLGTLVSQVLHLHLHLHLH